MTPAETRTRALVAARSAGLCETCRHRAGTDMSHRRRRRDTAWCPCSITLQCAECHRLLHAEPGRARRLGWAVWSYESPRRVPIMLAVGLYYLDCAGGIARVDDQMPCSAGNHEWSTAA